MLAAVRGDGATSSRAVGIARSFAAVVTVDLDVGDVGGGVGPEARGFDPAQPTISIERTTVPTTVEPLMAPSAWTLV
jgi:hypothetical protein